MDILETFDKPTHNSGHFLDYIITRKDSSGVSNLYVSDFISDHRALHVSLTCSRAHPERKQIEVRSLKRIQCDVLEADLIGVNIDRECTDVYLVVRQYDASLSSQLDKHAQSKENIRLQWWSEKILFKIVDTLLGRNKQTTLSKYDSPLTMASGMNIFQLIRLIIFELSFHY